LGPPGLDHEQRGEDDGRQGHDQAGQSRVWQLEALHQENTEMAGVIIESP
jgi:hypothetical protein